MIDLAGDTVSDDEVEAGRLDALAGYAAEVDASASYLEGFLAGQIKATLPPAVWPNFFERPGVARKRLLRRLAGEQNWRCCYCGVRMIDPKESQPQDPTQATLDHLIPRSAGGNDEPENLAVACRGCNTRKGNMGLLKFLRLLTIEGSARERRR